MFLSITAQANTPITLPDVVQLQGPYNATMAEVQASDVHLYVPDYGVATITLEGNDTFDTFTSNTQEIKGEIHKTGKTVLIKSRVSAGHSMSLGIVTKCGKGISITIHGLSYKEAEPAQIKPKLFINSANCPLVN